MRHTRLFMLACCLMMAAAAMAQDRYYLSYSDYKNNVWHPLDTLIVEEHSQSRKLWWGGNDFKFTTGDSNLDKTLKKEAFVISHGDSLYVNCRNLRFEKTRFGSGYTRAFVFKDNQLAFANTRIGKKAMRKRGLTAGMFGAIGAAISESNVMKHPVGYVITDDAESLDKGRVAIHMLNDEYMQTLLEGSELLEKYLSVKKTKERESAENTFDILRRMGWMK